MIRTPGSEGSNSATYCQLPLPLSHPIWHSHSQCTGVPVPSCGHCEVATPSPCRWRTETDNLMAEKRVLMGSSLLQSVSKYLLHSCDMPVKTHCPYRTHSQGLHRGQGHHGTLWSATRMGRRWRAWSGGAGARLPTTGAGVQGELPKRGVF